MVVAPWIVLLMNMRMMLMTVRTVKTVMTAMTAVTTVMLKTGEPMSATMETTHYLDEQ